MQERLDIHSIEIAGYSLKVEFRQNYRDDSRDNEVEFLEKGASVCIWKMIFKYHDTRICCLSESKSLSGG